MNYEKIVFRGRISYTFAKLSILCFTISLMPFLALGLARLSQLAYILYMAGLVLLAICSFFLLFFDENFINLLNTNNIEQIMKSLVEFSSSSVKYVVYFLIGAGALSALAIVFGSLGSAYDARCYRSKIIGITILILTAIYAVVFILTKEILLAGGLIV
ncbi:MAG: hypothetical protein RR086_02220 [Clostridia bacterium]